MKYDVYLQNRQVFSSLDQYVQNTGDFCTPNLNWSCSLWNSETVVRDLKTSAEKVRVKRQAFIFKIAGMHSSIERSVILNVFSMKYTITWFSSKLFHSSLTAHSGSK